MALGKIKADTLEHSTAGSLDTQYVVNGSAKAWINYKGTSTNSIRDSLNISSVTDAGTGLYTVNFSSSMNNADYSPTFAGGPYTSDNNRNTSSVYDSTVSLVKVGTWSSGGTKEDYALVSLHINGDLA